MKRLTTVLVLALLVALVVAQVATAVRAQPMNCAALVVNATAEQAAQELRGYASALQSEEYDASYGHVMTLLDLAEQLDSAPRYGCVTRVTPGPRPDATR